MILQILHQNIYGLQQMMLKQSHMLKNEGFKLLNCIFVNVYVCVFLFLAKQVFLSRELKSVAREREISSGYSLLPDWVLSDWSIC